MSNQTIRIQSPKRGIFLDEMLLRNVTDEAVSGHELAGTLASNVAEQGALRIVDEETAVEAAADGVFTYGLEYDGTRIASVYVYPDRIRIEFSTAPDVAVETANGAGLRVRPKAVRPPRTLVFVESPRQVAPGLDVVEAVCETLE